MSKAILGIALGLIVGLGFAALRPQSNIPTAAEELAVVSDAAEAPPATPEHISKGPVVSNLTPHSASIGWITDDEAPTEVRYSSDGKRWHTAVKPGAEHGHVVNITRLVPNTGYQFLIMTHGNTVSFTGAFHTRPL